jgi:[acyl-carrier-protein] S-malonyltransferase
MTKAFLFPGQGSQFIGMGADVYDAFPEAQARFNLANTTLGFSLTALMFGTGGHPTTEADALRQTEITQPALYVHSLAVMAVLETAGYQPAMTAGHSLGEYSALAAAGAIAFEDGLRIVRLRGEYMAAAGNERPGTMAAILGMHDADIERLCADATESTTSVVQPANYNAPGQVVISGDVDAIERAMSLAKAQGARRVVPLPVSGAFHSPLMEHARAGLAEALAILSIHPPQCPVYLNVTAQPTTDPEAIRTALLEQLTAPVRWSQTLQHMQADGAMHFLEVGAGKVLSGLVRRTLGRQTTTQATGTVENITPLLSKKPSSI